MPVFFSRRGSRKRTFLSLAGSVVFATVFAAALMSLGAGGISYADDGDSASVEPDSGTPLTLIPDTTWESANQVLELPQECDPNVASLPCEERASTAAKDSSSSSDDDDDDDVETAGIGPAAQPAPAPDENAAATTGGDFAMGGVTEYESEGNEEPPMVASYGWVVTYPVNNNSGPRMAMMAARSPWHFAPGMSSPLTQAATPLSSPWMSSPMGGAWGRPAGGPMMMPGMAFRMH
jgi:hypothetical protein